MNAEEELKELKERVKTGMLISLDAVKELSIHTKIDILLELARVYLDEVRKCSQST